MTFIIDPSWHMWFSIALTVLSIGLFVWEKLSIEVTSLLIVCLLLGFGQFFPLYDDTDHNLLNIKNMLLGFANPSLYTVLSLLIIGQAILQAQALNPLIKIFRHVAPHMAMISFFTILASILILSGIMNNTPLVILAIPIMQAIATTMNNSGSNVMMPLSYAAILGGMTTLIGSSTNLLVSSSLVAMDLPPFSFFEFTHIGLMMASVGLLYVFFVLPKLLPKRGTMTDNVLGEVRQFIAEIDVEQSSKLIGATYENGHFKSLQDVDVRLIQRAGNVILPPFENYSIQANDILIVSATRETLIDILTYYPGFVLSADRREKEMMMSDLKMKTASASADEKNDVSKTLAEIMVAPGSRLIDRAIGDTNFYRQYGCVVLGLQRRARMMRDRLSDIRLENSDTLLVLGSAPAIDALRNNRDFVALAGTTHDLPTREKAPLAFFIFAVTVGLAALGIASISVTSFIGAVMMILTKCLNLRQALRAIDRKIFLLIGSVLALGTALQVSGGAQAIADTMTSFSFMQDPFLAATTMFICVAILTNILTNNACAVLFTPIAVSLATATGIDPHIFALGVLFAANCSFATPIGYQTNLLVMGPGNYRFADFFKAGIPLIIIMWITFSLILKFYYGL